MTINESASASFFCNATSYPPFENLSPHITWSKLGDSSKVYPQGQQLVLQNASRHDAGTYVCKAENGVGLPDTAAAVLSVLREYRLVAYNSLSSSNNIISCLTV